MNILCPPLLPAIILVCASGLRAEVPKEIGKAADIAEYERGVASATNDLAKGVIRYEITGEPGPTDKDLKARARKDYNIEVVFHGCARGPEVFHDRGYLDTVVESLKKKYGFDPVRKLDEELRASRASPTDKEPK